MPSNLDIIQETYDAFAEGDIESVLVRFDDDITWIEAAGGPYGGVYHGPEEVVQNVFGPLDQEWDVFRVEPERFIDGGDTIVTTGTYSGTYAATDKDFEAEFAHVWELEDDDIVRMQQFVDTALHNEPLEA